MENSLIVSTGIVLAIMGMFLALFTWNKRDILFDLPVTKPRWFGVALAIAGLGLIFSGTDPVAFKAFFSEVKFPDLNEAPLVFLGTIFIVFSGLMAIVNLVRRA